MRNLMLAGGAVLLGLGLWQAPKLRLSTDVTAALPVVSAEAREWLDLSRRFGALDTFIVGLEEPAGPMTLEGLAAVKQVTDALAAKKAGGLVNVSSVTNVDSVSEGEDGSLETSLLIQALPSSEDELVALRARVAADAKVAGSLVSRDQRGYLVLVRVDSAVDGVAVASLVREVVEANRGPLTAHYFGAAFFTQLITQALADRAVLIGALFVALFFVVLVLTGRRPAAALQVLAATLAALVLWAGLAGAMQVNLNASSLIALLGVVGLAAVTYARGLETGAASRLPVASLIAVGLGALPLWRSPLVFVHDTGVILSLGALAVLLAGFFIFVPLAGPVEAGDETPRAPLPGRVLLAALALTLLCSFAATRVPFHTTPQGMFSADDVVGRALTFFDECFGGADVIQVSFKGDLRDPSTAARLMRLTELLEGDAALPDVRSVTQVLGFLNKGFAGFHRVPSSRESLGNLWFFLEGREDVRQLASGERDEAMLVVRIPSRPTLPAGDYVKHIEQAAVDSLKTGSEAAQLRLRALTSSHRLQLTDAQLAAVVTAAGTPLDEAAQQALDARVREEVREYLASPDSPYEPTAEEWQRVAEALTPPDEEKVKAAATTFPDVAEHAEEFAGTVMARIRDQRLALRTQTLVEQLGAGLPPDFQVRAAGVLVDVLDPHDGDGAAARVRVSGLPVVAPVMSVDARDGLRLALVALLGIGALVLLVLTRQLVVLGPALATVLSMSVLGFSGALGSSSAPVFLLAPVLTFAAAGGPASTSLRTAFLVALGAASLSLLAAGLLPVTHLALALAFSFGISAAAAHLVPPRPRK